jgi:hypothetical protein
VTTRDTRPAPRVLAIDPAGGPDHTAVAAVVTRRTQPQIFSIDPPGTDPPGTDPPGTDPPGTDPPGTDPPYEMPGSAAQRRVVMNGLYSHLPATLRANPNPYPEVTRALEHWCDRARSKRAVSVHESWSNATGYSGTGWTVEVGGDEVWSWDAWVPALVVLASAEDRVVGERRCPVCRGRGTFDEWTTVTIAGAGSLDGRYNVTGPMSCDRCLVSGAAKIWLLELVFAAAQGWPWAREHGSVIADRLQGDGDPWGHWLAALLEPRQWGVWHAYPKRRDHAGELAERLDRLTDERSLARGRVFDPVIRRAAMLAGLGFSVGYNVVVDDGEDPRLTAVTRGDTTTLTFHDDQPHTVRTTSNDWRSYPADYRGQPLEYREPDEVMSEAVFQRALDRMAMDGDHDDERPVTPPIGRNLERRLNRGRRGRG